jgi:hypothetical protein
MRTIVPALVLFAAATTLAAGPRPAAAADIETRHSGTITGIDDRAGLLTFEEMVTWTGPGTGIVTRSVRITPETSMQLVVRDQDPDRSAMPGFAESPITLRRLRDGDFVTVTTRSDAPVAVSLEVYRPDAEPAR